MTNPMGKYDKFLSDEARGRKYIDIEISRVRALFPVGTRVAYSSVGEAGVKAGLGEYGVITSPMIEDFLIEVDWDKSEPSWIEAHLLTLATVRPKCLRCGHTWFPRSVKPPKFCPSCNSPYWDRPRQIKRVR